MLVDEPVDFGVVIGHGSSSSISHHFARSALGASQRSDQLRQRIA